MSNGANDTRSGYGYFNANLNAFINPNRNESLFIKKMATSGWGESEGASYLGLGLIISVACVCFYAIKHRNIYFLKHKEIAIACLLLIVFAVSCNVHIGSLTILEYNVPQRFFAVFRSSGRFLWTVWYLLVFCAIYLLTKKYKSKVKFIIPILLVIQLIDLFPLFKAKREFINNQSKIEYFSQLNSQEWSNLFKEYSHIVFPPFSYSYDDKTMYLYYDFWIKALKYNITVNTGYITIEKKGNIIQTEKILNEVEKGKIPALEYKAMYILPDILYEDIKHKAQEDSIIENFVPNVKTLDGVRYILCD